MEFFRTLVKKHPIGVYYLVTFLISWGGLVFVVGGPGGITSQHTETPFLPLYLVTVAGPSVAGVLLTIFYGGKKGGRELLSRLFKWRLGVGWYSTAILIAPLTVFTSLYALSVIWPVFNPGIFGSGENPIAAAFGLGGDDKMSLLFFVLVLGLFNGFVEELGWTGFVTPRLRAGHTIIATGLNIGFMWGLWHFLSNYLDSAAGAGAFPLALYLPAILFSFLPPFRILMVWVCDHTESLFLAILMHASLDVFWILSTPYGLTGQQRVVWYLAWAVVLWITVAAVRLVSFKHFQD